MGSTNYRQMSSAPVFAKNFERLLLTQVTEFIDEHKTINIEHFGFHKKVSNPCSFTTSRSTFVEFRSKQRNRCYYSESCKGF